MRRIGSPRASLVVMAVVLVASTGVGAVALLNRNERDRARQERSPVALFDILDSTAFSPDDVPDGLSFKGVGSVLSPERADEENLWLVYATFGGTPGRAVVAFQVFSSPGAAAEFIAAQFGARCVRDEISWSCADSYGPVVVKGETKCIQRACRPSRRIAEALLAAGRHHLESIT